MKGILVQVRERGRTAALVLGVLTILGVLAALIAGPGAVLGSQNRTAAAADSSAGLSRPGAVHQPVSRATSDHFFAATRGHASAAASRTSGIPRHSPLGAAALPAALVVAALALAGLAEAGRDRRANRRTSMAFRGRAPPAPVLA